MIVALGIPEDQPLPFLTTVEPLAEENAAAASGGGGAVD